MKYSTGYKQRSNIAVFGEDQTDAFHHSFKLEFEFSKLHSWRFRWSFIAQKMKPHPTCQMILFSIVRFIYCVLKKDSTVHVIDTKLVSEIYLVSFLTTRGDPGASYLGAAGRSRPG